MEVSVPPQDSFDWTSQLAYIQ